MSPQNRDRFSAPVTDLPGVGPGTAEKLARLNVETVGDLILHLPYRYQDRTRSVPFDELQPGTECLATGRVTSSGIAYGRRRSLLTRLTDDRGALTIRLFHFSRGQQQGIRPGMWMRCFGEVRMGPEGKEMVHPEYRMHRGPAAPGRPGTDPGIPRDPGPDVSPDRQMGGCGARPLWGGERKPPAG